jgi:hypothetical protein
MSPRTKRPRAARFHPQTAQHRVRSVNPDKAGAGFHQWNRQPSGAASELQNGPRLPSSQGLPESHIAPRDGPRVLPVVKGGVLVPTLPTFAHASE